jgi:aerobic-type carbon monoxide dehydrogenase small subunit (CoxS/CutS family)
VVNAGDDIETRSRCIFPEPLGRTTMANGKPPDPPNGTNGVTRRGLIKGIASAVTAASAGATTLLVETRRELEASPAGELPVSLTLNGAAKTGSFEPRTTLAEALRDTWGLTGTKIGCDRGACGACTVLLDGVPVNSCLTLVHDAERRSVTTIEGIGAPEALAPVQRAFLSADALQCGFCTPGMVVSCAALLKKNPSPSREEVRNAVSGNLCRCGTYLGVFEACSSFGDKGVARG